MSRTSLVRKCEALAAFFVVWISLTVTCRGLELPDAGFHVDSWHLKDGLPDEVVSSVVQTSEGYLWLGTPKGLVQFDGSRFKLVGMTNINISSLFADGTGTIWIGTDSGAIYSARPGERNPKSLDGAQNVGARITELVRDRAGTLWASAMIKSDTKVTGFDVQSAPGKAITTEIQRASHPVVDSNGQAWAWTGGKLLIAHGTKMETVDEFPYSFGQLLAPAHDGGLLTVTGNWWDAGLTLATLRDGKQASIQAAGLWIKGSPRFRVTSLIEDRSRRVWLGTAGGGVYQLESTNVWQRLAADGPLSQKAIACIYQDKADSIWIGTQGGGLHRVRRKVISQVMIPGFAQNFIFLSVCASRNGGIWAGTDGAGVFHYSSNQLTMIGSGDNTNLYATSVFEDSHTNVWVGSAGGFWQLVGNEILPASNAPPLLKNVQVIFEDSKGRLWLGSRGRLTIKTGEEWETLGAHNGITHYDIRSITEDKQGAIWIAAYGSGIYRFNGGKAEFFDSQTAPGLATARILHVDRDGVLWIGCGGGGLLRQKNGEFTSWTADDGLPSNEIQAFLEDEAGVLWMNSNNGIFGCPKKELDEYYRGRSPPLLCRQIVPREAMAEAGNSGIGQPVAARSTDGKLWFCNSHALGVTEIKSLSHSPLPAPVLLEEIWTDGASQRPRNSETVSILSTARRIEFHYTSPVLEEMNLVFRYRLEGMDKDWVDAGKRRIAYYSQLPVGEYQFRVMAGNGANGWREISAPARVQVVPLWYQTAWFKILCGVLLTGTIAGGAVLNERRKIRHRLARLEMQQAVENERRRIAQDLHDDLGSQMTEIVLIGELAKRGEQTAEALSEQVLLLTKGVRQAVVSLEQTVWTVNPKNDSLSNLTFYLCDYCERFLKPAQVAGRLDIADNLPDVSLAAQTRHNLFLAVKEALNNAVKHSKATEIRLGIAVQNGLLLITLTDNGQGFEVGAVNGNGNGLQNLRNRLKAAGGGVEIQSEPGKGTTVSLKFPLPKTEPIHA